MRKEFSEAHKDQIIAGAYGRGKIYGEIAEWLLSPYRTDQSTLSADETTRQISGRMSGHYAPNLSHAYVMASLHMFKSGSQERSAALQVVLQSGTAVQGLGAYASDWHNTPMN